MTLTEQLKRSHTEEMGALQSQQEASKEATIHRLEEESRALQQEQLRANQLAVKAMAENMAQQSQAEIKAVRREDLREMAILRKQYLSEKDDTVEKLCVEHKMEVKKFQRDMEVMMADMKQQVLPLLCMLVKHTHRSTMEGGRCVYVWS